MPRNTSDNTVQRFKRGARTLSERHLNSIVEVVNRQLVGVDSPKQPEARGKGGSPVLLLTLVTHNGDYLVCEDANSVSYNVAKPYELRSTPFDGQTVGGVTYTYTSASERDASDGASPPTVETQFITPNYVVGAEIYAVKLKGGTGVQTDGSPAQDIQYIEINQGRAWAWDENA